MVLLFFFAYTASLTFEVTSRNVTEPINNALVEVKAPEGIEIYPEKIVLKGLKPGETREGEFSLTSSESGEYSVEILVNADGQVFKGSKTIKIENEFEGRNKTLLGFPLINPSGRYALKVYDIAGRLCYKCSEVNYKMFPLPENKLRPGIYFYRYKDSDGLKNGKFIILK